MLLANDDVDVVDDDDDDVVDDDDADYEEKIANSAVAVRPKAAYYS